MAPQAPSWGGGNASTAAGPFGAALPPLPNSGGGGGGRAAVPLSDGGVARVGSLPLQTSGSLTGRATASLSEGWLAQKLTKRPSAGPPCTTTLVPSVLCGLCYSLLLASYRPLAPRLRSCVHAGGAPQQPAAPRPSAPSPNADPDHEDDGVPSDLPASARRALQEAKAAAARKQQQHAVARAANPSGPQPAGAAAAAVAAAGQGSGGGSGAPGDAATAAAATEGQEAEQAEEEEDAADFDLQVRGKRHSWLAFSLCFPCSGDL